MLSRLLAETISKSSSSSFKRSGRRFLDERTKSSRVVGLTQEKSARQNPAEEGDRLTLAASPTCVVVWEGSEFGAGSDGGVFAEQEESK